MNAMPLAVCRQDLTLPVYHAVADVATPGWSERESNPHVEGVKS